MTFLLPFYDETGGAKKKPEAHSGIPYFLAKKSIDLRIENREHGLHHIILVHIKLRVRHAGN